MRLFNGQGEGAQSTPVVYRKEGSLPSGNYDVSIFSGDAYIFSESDGLFFYNRAEGSLEIIALSETVKSHEGLHRLLLTGKNEGTNYDLSEDDIDTIKKATEIACNLRGVVPGITKPYDYMLLLMKSLKERGDLGEALDLLSSDVAKDPVKIMEMFPDYKQRVNLQVAARTYGMTLEQIYATLRQFQGFGPFDELGLMHMFITEVSKLANKNRAQICTHFGVFLTASFNNGSLPAQFWFMKALEFTMQDVTNLEKQIGSLKDMQAATSASQTERHSSLEQQIESLRDESLAESSTSPKPLSTDQEQESQSGFGPGNN